MISPSDPEFVKPYSPYTIEHNVKPRVIKCIPCGYSLLSDLMAPICGNCKRKMITVIKDELAERNSESTRGTGKS
jgi:Zn finger protein HypA/HybF involved in hydrogenase expression